MWVVGVVGGVVEWCVVCICVVFVWVCGVGGWGGGWRGRMVCCGWVGGVVE